MVSNQPHPLRWVSHLPEPLFAVIAQLVRRSANHLWRKVRYVHPVDIVDGSLLLLFNPGSTDWINLASGHIE